MNKKILFRSLIPVPILIVIFFYWLHLKHTSNIPQLDDYDAVIYFLSNFINADTLSLKLQWLFSQHREHRYVFPRIVILLLRLFTGQINLLHILFIGHIALIGIYLLILKSVNYSNLFKDNLNKLLLIIFITALFFQLQYSEGSAWAIAAFFTYFGLLFSFISLYLLNSKRKFSPVFAILFALLATGTAGNGILTFIAGAFILFLYQKFSRTFFVWCAAGILTFGLYFLNYTSPDDHASPVKALLNKPFEIVVFFFSYIGSVFMQIPLYGNRIALIAGVVIFGLFLFLFRKKYFRLNPPVFGYILLLFLTIAVSSVTRVEVGFISRYTFFSVLFMMLIIIAYMELYSVKLKTYHLVLAAVLALIFNIYAFEKNYKSLVRTDNILIQGAILSKTGNNFLLGYPDSSIVRKLVTLGKENNIYELPDYTYEEFLKEDVDVAGLKISDNVINEFNLYKNNDTCLYVNGFVSMKDGSVDNSEVYLVLRSEQNTFVFKPNPMRRKELTHKNVSFDENKLSYSFVILKNGMNFPKGVYTLGFLIKNDSGSDLMYLNEQIVF